MLGRARARLGSGQRPIAGACHADDPRLERDPLAGEAAGAPAVEPLGGGADPVADQRRNAGAEGEIRSISRVSVDQRPSLSASLVRRGREDRGGHVDHPHLMEAGRLPRGLGVLALEAELDGRREGVGGGRLGVLARAGTVVLEGVQQGRAVGPGKIRRVRLAAGARRVSRARRGAALGIPAHRGAAPTQRPRRSGPAASARR